MNENYIQCVNENQQTPVVGRTPGVWNAFEINDTHKHPVFRSTTGVFVQPQYHQQSNKICRFSILNNWACSNGLYFISVIGLAKLFRAK